MYPPYKQSGYEQGDNAYAFDRASRWREPGQAQVQAPNTYQDWQPPQPQAWPQSWPQPAAPYMDPQHEVMWPPPGGLQPQLHHAHIAPVAVQKRGWPWRRSLVALSLTFAGGVYARPVLEQQVRAVPGEVRVVGQHLVALLPSWAQAQFTPDVAPAPSAPDDVQRVVTTPLPTPKARPVAAPTTPPQEAAPAALAPVAAPVVAEAPPSPPPVAKEAPEPKSSHHGSRRRAAKALAKLVAKPATVAMVAPAAAKAAPEPVVAPVAAPTPVAPARKAAPADSLDSLMARAMTEPDPSEAKPAAVPTATKAGALDRNQIVDVMKAMVANVNACGTGLVRPTNADLTITVDPSGSVSAVKVAGPLFASLTAGCIVRTVKAADFPESRGMTFAYRYTLKPTGRSASTALAEPARPERITGTASSGQAAPTASAPVERPRDLSVLPNLPSKVKVSDDPLAGLGGRSVEGSKAKAKARQR